VGEITENGIWGGSFEGVGKRVGARANETEGERRILFVKPS